MSRSVFFALAAACICSAANVSAKEASPSPSLEKLIAYFARVHGIPERLVRRVVKRESGFNPHLVHGRFYGLMQITYQSARSMGYKGEPHGLLDPAVNLTYAVPYLANAYKVAGGNESRAVRFYASGYYHAAKRKHLLRILRTAASPSLEPPPPPELRPAPPVSPPNPVLRLLRSLTGHAQAVPSN